MDILWRCYGKQMKMKMAFEYVSGEHGTKLFSIFEL